MRPQDEYYSTIKYTKTITIHTALLPLVKDLGQSKDLNIPLNPKIKAILATISTIDLARLSRASYFIGHWQPSLLPTLWDNSAGESWKISNCIDQELRRLLVLPHNIQIRQGVFRVTFSNLDCWLWEEFSLATHPKTGVGAFLRLKRTNPCRIP